MLASWHNRPCHQTYDQAHNCGAYHAHHATPPISRRCLRRQGSQDRPNGHRKRGGKNTALYGREQKLCRSGVYGIKSSEREDIQMQWKRLTILCQCLVASALWVCGLPALQSAASAQTSQDTQADKTSKHKKSKKSKAEATSSPTTAPAMANEKTSKAKKPKKSASEMTSSGTASRAQTSANPSTAPAPVRHASPAATQAAKASGKVWVNTETGVYHKGGQWYGATKQGKFMMEEDAMTAGYKTP